jgi:hypothetical protein
VTTARTLELRRTTQWQPEAWAAHRVFEPYARACEQLRSASAFPSVAQLNTWFANQAQVQFEVQIPSPRRKRIPEARESYDQAILSGRVPTREGSYHDLMNALVWSGFPKAKRAAHKLQYTLIERAKAEGLVGKRLVEHDALAIVDEGGFLVLSATPIETSEALVQALQAGSARWLVFGHGILECVALGSPKPMVGGLVVRVAPTSELATVDAALAQMITEARLPKSPRELLRVPSEVNWG